MAKEVQIILNGKDNASRAVRQVQLSAEGLHRKLQSMGNELQAFGRSASMYFTVPLLAAGGAALKFGMDAVESENLFTVAMGRMADAGREWSQQLRKDLGLNEFELRKQLGMFNAMFNSMGMGEQAAFEMSKGLTQLAYDMASFYNLNPEEAFQKLQAGISGEVEPLKRLGIVVNETTVKQWALNNGLIKQGQTLSEQGKILARYGAIMEQTAQAQNDMARTLDSPANQLRILQEELKQVAIEFGIALLPAATDLVPVLRDLTVQLAQLVGWFASLPSGAQKSIVALAGVAAAMGPLAVGIGGVIKLSSYGATAWTKFTNILVAEGQKWMATGMSMGAAAAMVAAQIMVVIGVILIWQRVIQGYSREWKHLGDDWKLTVLNIKRFMLDMLVFVSDVLMQAIRKFHIFYRGVDPLNILKLDEKATEFLDDIIQWSNEQQRILDEQEIEIGHRLKSEGDNVETVDDLLKKQGFDPKKIGEDMKKVLQSLLPSLTGLGNEFVKSADDIAQVRADLVDETKQLTLSDLEYQLWALDQERAHYEKTYAGKKDVLDDFYAYYDAKRAKILADARTEEERIITDLVDQTQRLTMSDLDYQLWALDQELEYFRKTYADKWQILNAFYAYYNAKRAELLADPLETRLSEIWADISPEALAMRVQIEGHLAGAMGGDWDPLAFQREALRNAAAEIASTMLEQGKSWDEIKEAIDPLIARFEELNETTGLWEELQKTVVADLTERLGTFGKLLEAIKSGNAGNILNALYAAIMDRVPQIADLLDMLIEGFTAILAPIGALLDLIEGLVGAPGLGALAGGGIGYLLGGPLGALLGGIAGLLGSKRAEEQRRQAEFDEFVNKALYGELITRYAEMAARLEYLLTHTPPSGPPMHDWFEEIEWLQENIPIIQEQITELLGITSVDLANAVADAFSAETAEEFTDRIASNLLTKVRDALIRAWTESAAMKPIFDQISELITQALDDGVMEAAELGGIKELIETIATAGAEFYQTLEELGLGLGDLADSVNEAASASRNIPVIFRGMLVQGQVAQPMTAVDLMYAGGRAPVYVDMRGAQIYGVNDLDRRIRESVRQADIDRGRAQYGTGLAAGGAA